MKVPSIPSLQKILFTMDDFHFLFHRKKLYSSALTVTPCSHLTSYTPSKSNLHLASPLAAAADAADAAATAAATAAAAAGGPDLHRLLTYQVPNLMSLFHCLGRTKVSVQIRGL